MKAVGFYEYGDATKLTMIELPTPTPGPNQVLVKEKATSINPIDWKLRAGYLSKRFDWPFPIVVGWDVAGTIEAVGSQVTEWHVGDEVLARPATTPRGTYAEYTLVDENLLAKKPTNVSFKQGAAVPLAGLTAWQALFDYGHLKAGQNILIQAGAGGVGTFAIQFAKHAGAKVWTTASKSHAPLLTGLGADHVLDYHDPTQFEQLPKMDLIFDTLGGQNQLQAFNWLKTGGTQVSIVGQTATSQAIADQKGQHLVSIWLTPNGRQLTQIADLMAQNIVKSVISTELPFSKDNLIKAHQLSETGHTEGKIVITFD